MGTVFGKVGAGPPAEFCWQTPALFLNRHVPAAISCCWTPLVVIGPTCVNMFCRALKMPQLARKADLPLPRTSQAKPTRGLNSLYWFGSFPVEGKAGLLRSEP